MVVAAAFRIRMPSRGRCERCSLGLVLSWSNTHDAPIPAADSCPQVIPVDLKTRKFPPLRVETTDEEPLNIEEGNEEEGDGDEESKS